MYLPCSEVCMSSGVQFNMFTCRYTMPRLGYETLPSAQKVPSTSPGLGTHLLSFSCASVSLTCKQRC